MVSRTDVSKDASRKDASRKDASRTNAFFEELNRRGHEPGLRNRTATVCFDIAHGKKAERWIVTIDNGNLSAALGDEPGDCAFRVESDLFDRLTSGQADAMAAMLRGMLLTDGDVELLVAARRLMVMPPRPVPAEPELGQADEAAPATTSRRRS